MSTRTVMRCACSLLGLTLFACELEQGEPDELGDESGQDESGQDESGQDESGQDESGQDESDTGGEGDCPKIFVDPVPELGPGDAHRLVVEVYAEPKGDIHGGRWEVGYFFLDDFDDVNCYDLDDANWPPTGPNAFSWSYILEAYVRDMNSFDLLDGYFTRICPLNEDCQPEDFDPLPDIHLPAP